MTMIESGMLSGEWEKRVWPKGAFETNTSGFC